MKNQGTISIYFYLIPILVNMAVLPLSAKTILFRDGTKIRAEVIGQDQSQLNLKMPDGELRTVSKDLVLKVYFKDILSPEEEAAIRRKELLEDKKRQEYADILSKSITPLPRESAELTEEEVMPSDPAAYKRITREGAFFRSLVLPGWGQFYQGRPIAGSMYAMLIAGGGYALYEKNRIYRNAKRDLDRLENPFSQDLIIGSLLGANELPSSREELENSFLLGGSTDPIDLIYNLQFAPIPQQRNTVKRHKEERESIAVGIAAIWLWNAFDTLIFHPSEKDPVIGFQENLDRGNFYIGLDSQTIKASWETIPSLEHRIVFSMNF